MRVEGQGIAVDFVANAQVSKPVADKSDAGANRLKTGTDILAMVKDIKESERDQDIQEAAQILNEAMTMANCHLEFQPYEKSGQYQVKVVDNRTKTIIKEIPPDYMLELAGRFKEMLDTVVGLFVNEIV